MDNATEQWRDIPGYDGMYQISNLGRVRSWRSNSRVLKRRSEPHLLTPTGPGLHKWPTVSLTDKYYQHHCVNVVRTVATVWLDLRPGLHICMVNGDPFDPRADNIVLKGKPEGVCMSTSAGIRRKVVKIDREGRVVEAYASAREAAERNYMGIAAVMARCNGKIVKEFDEAGCTYRFG